MKTQERKRREKIVSKFRELEEKGLVRIKAEPEEEGYFDVYGEPYTEKEKQELIDVIERDGCWWVVSEYLTCEKCGTFEHADSIGMCVYRNPLDPFENDYVVDLMQSAIDKVKPC